MEYGTYFLFTALSVLVGCALAVPGFGKNGLKIKCAGPCILSAVLCSVAGARLYYIVCRVLPGGGEEFALLSAYPYEYAACGAVLGAMGGCALAARLLRLRPGRALDALAPGGMAALALERISEIFADSAWGGEILEEGWQFFPVAVRDEYGSFYGAVNLLEAALALAVFFVFFRKKGLRDGVCFALMLLWWSMGQILCESLRAETLRWGFVRVQQVQCAVFGAAVLLWGLKHLEGTRGMKALIPAAYLAGVGAVIALEFALDRLSWPKWLDYILMASALWVMGMAGHLALRGRPEGAQRA